jgi:glutathione synthase/RimK-type ligase-like ATP-grasp enzyme
MHSPEDLFSKEEVSCILQLANIMGAEFCEFDVLRDKSSGRIYVIDVNKTPYGPPKGLTSTEHKTAIDLLAGAFQQAFIKSH